MLTEDQKQILEAAINDPKNPPRHCVDCKKLKPIFAFYKDGYHKDKVQKYRPECKVCTRKRYKDKDYKGRKKEQEANV